MNCGGGDSGDRGRMRFQHGDESGITCPSSGMRLGSAPTYANKAISGGSDAFFAPEWEPIVSLRQHESFGSPAIMSHSEFSDPQHGWVMASQGTSGLSQYLPSSSYIETVPELPAGGASQLLPRTGSNGQVSGEGASSEALNRKRKHEALSTSCLDQKKNPEERLGKDASIVGVDVAEEQKEKKPEFEQNPGANSRGKRVAKQAAKDNSQVGEAPQENYIHVRARRGQATNSHSLAERVRREKISERMRLLQELVPGCNKITGKAVMLDEIINYVQSLQQQVEFLSMKLATVNPELNFDIDGVLSKDLLHSRSGNMAVPRFSPVMNHQSHLQTTFQGTLPTETTGNPQFPPPLHQTVLDTELQNLLQTGFVTSSTVESLAQNNWRLKPEF